MASAARADGKYNVFMAIDVGNIYWYIYDPADDSLVYGGLYARVQWCDALANVDNRHLISASASGFSWVRGAAGALSADRPVAAGVHTMTGSEPAYADRIYGMDYVSSHSRLLVLGRAGLYRYAVNTARLAENQESCRRRHTDGSCPRHNGVRNQSRAWAPSHTPRRTCSLASTRQHMHHYTYNAATGVVGGFQFQRVSAYRPDRNDHMRHEGSVFHTGA